MTSRIAWFGQVPDGAVVERITLGQPPGPELQVLTLGGIAHRLDVTCGDGRRRNVALGHATPEHYLASGGYIGGIVGRYANRIAAGQLEIDGVEHRVGVNDRGNHLHGGPEGFDRRVWEVVEVAADRATLRVVSPDGDQGFPGTLVAEVTYRVSAAAVRIELTAVCDAATVVNLTSHAYFNLDGDGEGVVDDHRLMVAAEAFTPVDGTGIPLGGHVPVAGTPFDLREPTRIGDVTTRSRSDDQLAPAGGLDHNFVVTGTGLRTHAVLESPLTRTTVAVRSDQPGLQVYTGNDLEAAGHSTSGVAYRRGSGIALEPQLFPDSPHHPDWPSAGLGPGETYRHTLEWVLGVVPGR